MGEPPNEWFIRDNPMKNGWFWGNPHFRKPPYLFLCADVEKATHPPKHNFVEILNTPSRAAISQLSRGVFARGAGSVFL